MAAARSATPRHSSQARLRPLTRDRIFRTRNFGMRPVARPVAKRARPAAPLRRPRTHASDVDEILKILVFLYTENRRFTKQLAARASLTGPQLTVVKMLETM